MSRGRIGNLEQIKEANDLAEVIAEVSGFSLKTAGRKYTSTQEHDSLQIDNDKQMYYWNSRNQRGDVIQAVMDFKGLDFASAVEYLANRKGLPLTWDSPESAQRHLATRIQRDTLTVIAEFMAAQLGKTPLATAYAHKRGWGDKTIQKARLGYWHGSLWPALLDRLKLHSINPTTSAVLAVRDVPKQEPWLVYAHYHNGKCVYLSMRSIENVKHYKLHARHVGESEPYYNHVYGRHSKQVVIVEGQADAVSLGQLGIAAVALCGLAAGDYLPHLAERHQLLLGLDADKAADKNTSELIKITGGYTRVVAWPTGKDANDWLRMESPTPEDAQALLEQAQPYILQLAGTVKGLDGIKAEATIRAIVSHAATLSEFHYQMVRDPITKRVPQLSKAALDGLVKAKRTELAAAAADPETTPAGNGGAPSVEIEDIELRTKLLTLPPDHEGHAQCVLAMYPDSFLYVSSWGWMAYDGLHWVSDAEQQLKRAIVDVLRTRSALAFEKNLDKVLAACPADSNRINGISQLVQSIEFGRVKDFDGHPDHFNCANGIIDLRTGEIEPHSPQFRFTWVSDHAYSPDQSFDEWKNFVLAAVGGDVETYFWLQELCGYILTGYISEEIFVYLYGPPRSGKGTFTETLLALLARPVATEVAMDMFFNNDGVDTNNFHLAPLAPSRLVVASETPSYKPLDSTMLKNITGGSEIYASHKGKPHFGFKPKFTIVMSSNWPVNMPADDDAAWRRVRVVPFPNGAKAGQADPSIKRRMLSDENLAVVLAWAVEGAKRWYANGQQLRETPTNMLEAAQRMRTGQDLVGTWLNECTITGRENAESYTPTSALMASYKEWCNGNGVRPKGHAAFKLSMETKGFKSGRSRFGGSKNAVSVIYGVTLPELAQNGDQAKLEF